MGNILRGAAASIVVGLVASIGLAPTASADFIGYDIGWTGSAGYSMTGAFSFDDVNAGDGRIEEDELSTFYIDGFQNGVSIGSWNLADGPGAGSWSFNFNFNPVTEAFFGGGLFFGPNGQQWNVFANSGLGFISTLGFDIVTLNGDLKFSSLTQSALTATRQVTVEVPEPATLALFGAGLAGLGLMARRRKAA